MRATLALNRLTKRECCIRRKYKTKKGGNNYQKRVIYVTEKGAKSLKNAAIIRNDSFVVTKISNLEQCQIIAKECQ